MGPGTESVPSSVQNVLHVLRPATGRRIHGPVNRPGIQDGGGEGSQRDQWPQPPVPPKQQETSRRANSREGSSIEGPGQVKLKRPRRWWRERRVLQLVWSYPVPIPRHRTMGPARPGQSPGGLAAPGQEPFEPELQKLMDEQRTASSKRRAKALHQANSRQGVARRELHRLREERYQFLSQWDSYLEQLVTLLKKQTEEKDSRTIRPKKRALSCGGSPDGHLGNRQAPISDGRGRNSSGHPCGGRGLGRVDDSANGAGYGFSPDHGECFRVPGNHAPLQWQALRPMPGSTAKSDWQNSNNRQSYNASSSRGFRSRFHWPMAHSRVQLRSLPMWLRLRRLRPLFCPATTSSRFSDSRITSRPSSQPHWAFSGSTMSGSRVSTSTSLKRTLAPALMGPLNVMGKAPPLQTRVGTYLPL